MIDLNRRQLLAGAATAVAATALTPLGALTAHAAVPPAGSQAPGFYRYKVGAYECTSINDGARSFPLPDTFVKNVPKQEALAAAEAAYMPKGMVTVPFNPQLINTGGKLILIDNGVATSSPQARSAAPCKTSPPPASIPRASTSCCCRICIPITPTASAPWMVRSRFRTPKSWCPRSTGRSGPATKTPPRRNPMR